jgi:hypothetical protein
MPSHRRVAHAIPPVLVTVVPLGEAADNAPKPAGDVAVTAGRRRIMRNAAAAASASLAGGSAGYAFGGPVVAIFAIVAAGVLGIAAAVVLSAVLSNRDPRSPFERLMLILCVLLSRPPGTYLPQRR